MLSWGWRRSYGGDIVACVTGMYEIERVSKVVNGIHGCIYIVDILLRKFKYERGFPH